MGKKEKKAKKNFNKKEIYQALFDIFDLNPGMVFTYKQLAQRLNIKGGDQQLLVAVLREMKSKQLLTEIESGKFQYKENKTYVTGIIDLTARGTAYLISDECEDDVFIPQVGLKHALNGDKVRVLLSARSRRRRPEGEVVEILERKKTTFVGIIQRTRNYSFLVPTGKQLPYDIFIPLNCLHGAKHGEKAVVKITEWPDNQKNPVGEVLEVLGTSDPVKLVALAEDILACNVEGALSKISAMCDLGKSMAVLASDLATLFRNALYVKNCGDAAELLALPNELYAALKELSSRYDQSRLLAAMRRMTEMEGEFRYSTQHRILLEAAVIAAATEPRAEHGGDTRELEQKVAAIAKRVNALSRSGFEPAPAAKDAGQVWGNVASELQRMGVGVLAIAAAEAKAEEHEDALVVKVSSESAMRILSDPANRKLLSEAAAKYSAKPLRIEEVRRIEENKVIPYLTGMFGKSLEIT